MEELKRKKVLYVISKINKGGPVNQLLYLCRYLDRAKIDFTILTLTPRGKKNTIYNDLVNLGYEIIELNLSMIRIILFAKNKIQKIVDEKGINIVHCFGISSDYIVSRLINTYRITSVRNTLLVNSKMIFGSFWGSIIGRFHLGIIKKFDKVIACSISVKEHLKQFSISSIVIQNAIDNQITYTITRDIKESEKSRFGLPLEKKVFITVNSNLPGKNVGFLLEVFKENPYCKNFMLVVTGYSELKLKNKYQNCDNIIFTGKVDNFINYLIASDYFVSASLHEGMPNAVLEALSLGIPVLLSDIESHKEIMQTMNSNIGEIFKNNDKDELIVKIANLLCQDYKLLSENSKNSVNKYFSANKMAKQFQLLYYNV